jgi:hypothetical protein
LIISIGYSSISRVYNGVIPRVNAVAPVAPGGNGDAMPPVTPILPWIEDDVVVDPVAPIALKIHPRPAPILDQIVVDITHTPRIIHDPALLIYLRFPTIPSNLIVANGTRLRR